MDFKARVKALEALPLIQKAYALLKAKLPKHLYYHSFEHSRDVLSEAVRFALEDKLSDREIELLSIAAAFHDLGFIERAEENEELGAKLAVQAMTESGQYTKEEADLVSKMILETQVKIVLGTPKQIPTTKLSKYLLDADVSNLGRTDFFEKAELVRAELKVPNKKQFYSNLRGFIGGHQWYSPAAITLQQRQKEANIAELKRRLDAGGFND